MPRRKKEDSMSWRQNQQTSCIYRLVGNNVDYCEDTISVKTAQILRMKNQKNACSINVEHAISIFIDVVYGSMMHCLLGGELLSNLLFQLVMSPVILYCNILPILNAILIPKRNTIRPICVFEVCYFVEFVPQRLLLYIRCLWNLHLTRDIERHAEAWAYI